MKKLIFNHIELTKNKKYLDDFKEDIHYWAIIYLSIHGKLIDEKPVVNMSKNNKRYELSISDNIDLSSFGCAISDSLNSVSIMAYRYGVFNNTIYHNINASKFIGQFIFDFMRYLPMKIPKGAIANSRRINARVALHIMKMLMSLSPDKDIYIKRMVSITEFLKGELEYEIIFKLADRQLTEEWLYIYCKSIRKIIDK